MSYFNDFLEEELDLLISLPARVGLWISRIDDVKDSDRDDHRERRALEVVLEALSKSKKTAPFVSEIVRQTLTYRHKWEGWRDSQDRLMQDIALAVRLVDDRLPKENARNYKKALWQVARSVAQAWGEYMGSDEGIAEEAMLGGLFLKIVDAVADPISDDPQNISSDEKEALKKLRAILKGEKV